MPLLRKISNITQLQDARYCAATGFDMLSFNIERGHPKKLSTSMIAEMSEWIEGLEIVLEINALSLEELKNAKLKYSSLSFPIEEAEAAFATDCEQIILRSKAALSASEIEQLIEQAEAKAIRFELDVTEPLGAEYEHLLPSILLHFGSVAQAQSYINSNASKSLGLSLGDEVEDGEGFFDYELLDDFSAIFTDVHL